MKNYFRVINALLPKWTKSIINGTYFAVHLRSFLFLFFVILAGVMLQILVALNNRYDKVRNIYAHKSSEYQYWSSVASQYPNIPDILYNASVSAFNFGKKTEANEYLIRAIKIDPLFKKAQIFQKEIEG